MRDWLQSKVGKYFFRQEKLSLENAPNSKVETLLQISEAGFAHILAKSDAKHKILLSDIPEHALTDCAQLYSKYEKIPLACDSVNRVLLIHCLEQSSNPPEVLREAYRVLAPEAHAVITCFNPWSLWGLWRIFAGLFGAKPWRYKFISAARLKDWANVLGFELSSKTSYCYLPPIGSRRFLHFFSFIEKLAKLLHLPFAASNLIVLQKRVIPLTPLHVRWSSSKPIFDGELASPSISSRSPQSDII